jgi:hypothetical protein
MSKNKKKCKAVLVYNIHNKAAQWDFINKILDGVKHSGYNKIVIEASYKDQFKEFKSLANLIESQPDDMKDLFMKEVAKGSSSKANVDEEKIKVTSIRNIKSPYFKIVLNKLNDNYLGNPGSEQYIKIGDKKITFPISMHDIEKLDKLEQDQIIEQLKDLTIRVINTTSDSMAKFSSVMINALIKGFKVLGMDVDNECGQSDLACRDEFMAKKLMQYCLKGKGGIVATVGLSHTGLGQIIRESHKVDLKEYYPTDYQYSDSKIHDYLLSSQNKEITVLDTRNENTIEIILGDICDIDLNEGL